MDDYTPSEPPNDGELQGTPSFPPSPPQPTVELTAPAEPVAPPVLQDHLLPAVREHLDDLSDQPKPSIEPEPPTMPPTPMHLDPVTFEAYSTIHAGTFKQQRLQVDRQETLSFGPQRARHHEKPSSYEKPPNESSEMAFEIQDLHHTSLPRGWTFNKTNLS